MMLGVDKDGRKTDFIKTKGLRVMSLHIKRCKGKETA
jgi:hypothetical protein